MSEHDPVYERSAKFRCEQCRLTYRRDQCHIRLGLLICPSCHCIGTLKYIPESGGER